MVIEIIMKLQTYKGWTVDYRLEQFRKVKKNGEIIFLDFDSERGDRLLCQMIKDNVLDFDKYKL